MKVHHDLTGLFFGDEPGEETVVTLTPARRYQTNDCARWICAAVECAEAGWTVRAARCASGYSALDTHADELRGWAGLLDSTAAASAWLASDEGRAWFDAFMAEPIVLEAPTETVAS